jgi:uncharacterized membrane protein
VREYISPNWHVILVHAPLGLLSVGIIMEFFGFLWRRSTARIAARWMIAVGAVTAVPAATSGIYGYYDAVSPITSSAGGENANFGDKWIDLKDSAGAERMFEQPKVKGEESAAELLRHHIWWNASATGIIFLVVFLWIALTDRWRRRLYFPLLALLIAGEGLMILGSHFGGQAVYRHGIGQEPPAASAEVKPTREEVLAAYAPPAQVHVTMAGWMISLALIALALSVRAIVASESPAAADENWYREHGGAAGDEVSDAVGLNPDVPLTAPDAASPFDVAPGVGTVRRPPAGTVVTPGGAPAGVLPAKIPASRFWVLACVCAVIALASGLWIVGFYGMKDKGDFLKNLFLHSQKDRQKYHAWLGSAIVVLTLVLALVALGARRAKWIISAVSVLLLLSIAAEVWIGILLMFDGGQGPVKGFNPPKKAKSEARQVMPGDATESFARGGMSR